MQILELYSQGSHTVTDELFALARGPDDRVNHYTSYMINGWRFNTKDRDMVLQSQNSGVFVKADDVSGSKDYFGVLTDIIKLTYGIYSVVLFKCEWWDVHSRGRGIKKDKNGFTLINTSRTLPTDVSYILAAQAEQVYYVKDTKDPKWLVVVKTKPRDFFDLPPDREEDNRTVSNIAIVEACQENEEITAAVSETRIDDDGSPELSRPGDEDETVEAQPINNTEEDIDQHDDDEESEPASDGDEYTDSDDDNDVGSEEDIDDS